MTITMDAPQLFIGRVNLAYLKRLEPHRLCFQLPRIDNGKIRIQGDPTKPFQYSIENHAAIHLALTHA